MMEQKRKKDEEKKAKKLKGDEKKHYIKLIDKTKLLFFLAFSSDSKDINTIFKIESKYLFISNYFLNTYIYYIYSVYSFSFILNY